MTSSHLLKMGDRIRNNPCFDAIQFPSLKHELKAHWDIVMMEFPSTANDFSSNAWFDRLYEQHNETGRYYHTAVHLKELMEYFTILQESEGSSSSSTASAVRDSGLGAVYRLAVFFHDAIYDPKSRQNEKDSAVLFEQFCNEHQNIPNVTQTMVVTLILATEKHQVVKNDDNLSCDEGVQRLFLDMDMAVLGKHKEAYMAYAGLIRQEYSFVPEDVYCEKRAEVLTKFLQHSRIYVSDVFHTALEESARQNLQAEIDLLKANCVPS